MGQRDYSRSRRVALQMRRELASILAAEASDPRFSRLTLTSIQLSQDFGNARVYFTLPPDEERRPVEKALNNAVGFLRHSLSERLHLRSIPNIRFAYDNELDKAMHISSLLNGSLKSNRKE